VGLARSAIFCTGSVAPTGFYGCYLRASFFANYRLVQVLYASPPHEASTATSFSDFRPAHARASLRLFSLFFLACCLIFLQLCQSPLCPLSSLFRVPTATSFQCPLNCTVSACTRSAFISLYFCCLFACNKSFLDWPAFGCDGSDAWSKLLGCGRKFYPVFLVEEDKCWYDIDIFVV
jgi:hypothetical protein